MPPPRDYAHLYSSNALPNPQESRAIQREVNNLKSKIANLKSQLRQLEEELHQHEVVLSPIRRIPAEVLGEIFSLVLPFPLDHWDREELLALCLVCKPWRGAALAARWIWRSASVSADELSYGFEKVVCWLNRSGDFPKSLHVFIVHGADSEDCGDLGARCKSENAILAKFLTDGPILDHLEIQYRSQKCFRNLVEALHIYSVIAKPRNRPWDYLRSLAFDFFHDWDRSDDEADSIFHHIPSKVTSLNFALPLAQQMRGRNTSDIPLHISPDALQRLTCLTFTSNWKGDHGLQLLKYCYNIEILSLDILSKNPFGNATPFASSDLTSSMVHLPRLRTLHLRLLPVAVNMFLFLDTPNLVSLDLQLPPNHEPEMTPESSSFAQTVLAFVNRSKCQDTLRHLGIGRYPFPDEELASLLRGLPFVTHLTLSNPSIHEDTDFFEELCSPTLALPHLQVLKLLDLPPRFDFGVVEDFLQSRCSARLHHDDTSLRFEGRPDSLKEVIATYQETLVELDRDDSSYLTELRRSGMLVSVGPSHFLDTHGGALALCRV